MIKKMIRAVLFVLGLALMIRFMTEVLRPRSREALSSSYYEIAGKGCDVLFVGNSLIMNAVYPMQLYEEYGMAGYNLGSGGQSLLESCYLIEDGIRRFHPKLIVLDTTQLIVRPPVQKIAFLHYLTDNMPPCSLLRTRMIADFVHSMQYTPDEAAALMWPITIYHALWEEMDSLHPSKDPKADTAGAKVTAKVLTETESFEPHKADPEATFSELAVETLDRIIRLCEETGTKLCFVSIPLQSVSQKGYNRRVDAAGYAERRAGESGIPMFNKIQKAEELGIDKTHDSSDGFHMNAFGSGKFTSALGAFLHKTFDLPGRRGDSGYAFMDELDKAWRKEKLLRMLETATVADDRAALQKEAEENGLV